MMRMMIKVGLIFKRPKPPIVSEALALSVVSSVRMTTVLVSCDRALWAKCEERENQQDATIRCLLLTSVSTCFGYHYAHLQENKDRVTAYGVLCWFCWMWLVAVVGRCVVGSEQCQFVASCWFSLSFDNGLFRFLWTATPLNLPLCPKFLRTLNIALIQVCPGLDPTRYVTISVTVEELNFLQVYKAFVSVS